MLASATAALCAAKRLPYAYVMQARPGHKARCVDGFDPLPRASMTRASFLQGCCAAVRRGHAPPTSTSFCRRASHGAIQHGRRRVLHAHLWCVLARQRQLQPWPQLLTPSTSSFQTGALDGESFGFRPAPSVAPDFASLPSVLPDLPAVANFSWQAVGAVGASVDAPNASVPLDALLVSAPNPWGAFLPAVAPVAATASSTLPLPPPLLPQVLPLSKPPPPLFESADTGSVETDASTTTQSSAAGDVIVAAPPAVNDRSALLAALQTDNPLARLKKSGAAAHSPPLSLHSSAVPSSSAERTDVGERSSAAPGQLPPAAAEADPHASLMSAILLGPKLRSSAERRVPGPRPTVAETPREALMEAIKVRLGHALSRVCLTSLCRLPQPRGCAQQRTPRSRRGGRCRPQATS